MSDDVGRDETPLPAPSETDRPPGRGDGALGHARRLLLHLVPWVSLGFSIGGAVWMERDESRAAEVAAAVAGSWLSMSALLWLRRRQLDGDVGLLLRAADYAGISVAQSLAQLPLFFSAPFYVLAFAWTPSQVMFLLLFAVAALVTSWDPLAERVLTDRWLGPLCLAFGSFVGLRVALSMLGLSVAWTLGLSVVAVAVSFSWDLRMRWPDTRPLARRVVTAALCLGLLAMAPAMPAAPMRLVSVGLGTGVDAERQLVGQSSVFATGTRLWCWTAIFAPRQARELLVHRWLRDDQVLADLNLEVTGGRERGFRTWSRLTAGRAGHFRCEVRTRVGQLLGGQSATVE